MIKIKIQELEYMYFLYKLGLKIQKNYPEPETHIF
jgi:hypothetical protein